jgi:carbon-monoxide dehydrogenase large subunit
MHDQLTANQMATLKFGVGQSVPRSEDPKLLRGEGHYTDDVNLPGQAHGFVVRSHYAHGKLRDLDLSDALGMPGVLGIFTAADLDAAGYGSLKCLIPLKNRDGSDLRKPWRGAFAGERVRYVGDPLALVVAETPEEAKDAAEAVIQDIEPLPCVTEAAEAVGAEAPQLYEDAPGNVALDYHYGDADAVAEAFAEAAHVTRLKLRNNRVVVNALEPRAGIADYDTAQDHWTLHVGCQGVFPMRNQLAEILGVEKDRLRVLTGNVGGSFGMKASVYPEYVAILFAARALGRPVKWTDERSLSFLSDHHGRDHEVEAELALDKKGRFLAVRITGFGNMGAYLSPVAPLMPSLNIVKNTVSVYRTPLIEVSSRCVFTNTPPVTAYRGAGRPEGNYYMERLIDVAAREMGIDRIELRRRNLVQPSEIPYSAASGMVYDSGDFPGILEEAVALADLPGFPARREKSAAAGKLRGLGITSYLEVTAPPGPEMGGLRFEADGTVTIITGTLDYGQGHATPFAQVLHENLGIPFDRIRLLQGDSDELIAGGGTGGSRSIMTSGGAIVTASKTVIERGKEIAAQAMETAVEDIEFHAGSFVVAGTDRSIDILDLAKQLRQGLTPPEGIPATLDVSLVQDPTPSAFPNGCHVAEVEVDPETGVVEVVRYRMVNDFGTIVNPLLVEGQAHGGVVQGIGQATMEQVVFDEEGQLLTGSFMDYALPRAADLPTFAFASHPVPATTNALGAKGCGEAGCAGSLPSVMNALHDALRPLGVGHIDMPATPHRVWQAIAQARGKA